MPASPLSKPVPSLTHTAPTACKTIRTLIERQGPAQEQFAFMEEHAVIRPLSEYTRFVHVSFQKEVSS